MNLRKLLFSASAAALTGILAAGEYEDAIQQAEKNIAAQYQTPRAKEAAGKKLSTIIDNDKLSEKEKIQKLRATFPSQQEIAAQKEKIREFREKAEKGDAKAQFNLGNCYYDGIGVAEDLKQAVFWFRKAAEQGNVYGQYLLGICYENGEGVEADRKQAIFWFRKAAGQGYADAQCNVGYSYEVGGDGVEKDLKQAVLWYRKAAEQGNADAKSALKRLGKE